MFNIIRIERFSVQNGQINLHNVSPTYHPPAAFGFIVTVITDNKTQLGKTHYYKVS